MERCGHRFMSDCDSELLAVYTASFAIAYNEFGGASRDRFVAALEAEVPQDEVPLGGRGEVRGARRRGEKKKKESDAECGARPHAGHRQPLDPTHVLSLL